MDKNELNQLINEVRNTEVSKTSLDILEFVTQHKAKVMSEFYPYIKNFEDYFHELTLVIDYINYIPKNNWKNHKGIQYLFFPHALKTLHCSFENSIDGYYDESIMLCRSAFESFLRIVFLSCYPSDWESVFVDKKGERQFNVTSFTKEHLKINWEFIYKIMCWTSHSNIFRSGLKLKEKFEEQNATKISLEYSWDKDNMAMSINNVILTLTCLFHAMFSIFEKDLIKYSDLSKVQKINNILIGVIETNPKENFASLAKDIKKIGEIIKVADSGEDWKKIV